MPSLFAIAPSPLTVVKVKTYEVEKNTLTTIMTDYIQKRVDKAGTIEALNSLKSRLATNA